MSKNDHELGMHRTITRRDFVNGAAISVADAASVHELALT
jgi:hypothetical protein